MPQPKGRRPKGTGIYIRQIPRSHGISNIYYFSILTKKQQIERGSHHQFYTNVSGLQSWVHKTWAVISQNVLDTLHRCTDSLLKCDCVFCAIEYSYCHGMPTYVLVHITYLQTLRTKFTWNLTCETTLTHLKIQLWVLVVLMLPCQVFWLLRYFCKMTQIFNNSVLTLRNCLRHLPEQFKGIKKVLKPNPTIKPRSSI